MDSTNHQVGGDHYARHEFQPIEFILANRLAFCEGNVVKYVVRHKYKGGRRDIEKAMQYLQFILDSEYTNSSCPIGEEL